MSEVGGRGHERMKNDANEEASQTTQSNCLLQVGFRRKLQTGDTFVGLARPSGRQTSNAQPPT